MEAKEAKTWLVRTRTGEIKGPYAQRDLQDLISTTGLTAADEICPSLGTWISASNLLNRDADEFTRTSTRNVTLSTTLRPDHSNSNLAEDRQQEITHELTPTPDFASVQRRVAASNQKKPINPPQRTQSKGIAALVVGLGIVVGLWWMTVSFRPDQDVTGEISSTVEGGDSAESENITPFVNRIYSMIDSGQTATALQTLSEYHEKHGEAGNQQYLIPYAALLIVEEEAHARARRLLKKVIASNTDSKTKAQAHHWLGYSMLSQDEGDMGREHFLQSLQLNPKDPAARFNLGRAHLKQQRFRQALDYLQLAEVVEPNLWLVHIYKGRAKAALGLFDEAEDSFKKAIQLSKDRWIGYIYHALFLFQLGKQNEARATLNTMLNRDPAYEQNSPPPLGYYQESVNYADYLNAFVRVFKGASGRDKELGKVYISYLLAGPGSRQGKKIEAIAKNGSLASKVLSLKVALDREAPPPELEKSIGRLPAHLSTFGYYAYVLRGEAYMRTNNLPKAKADLQRALTLDPQAAVSTWAYATLLQRTGQKEEATAKIKGLRESHPNYIPAIVTSQSM